MYGLYGPNIETAHKEGSIARIKRDVKVVINCFSSGYIKTPFLCEENDVLKSFATNLV